MSTNGIKKFGPFTLGCVLAALFAVTPLVSGQVSTTQSAGPQYHRSINSEWLEVEVQGSCDRTGSRHLHHSRSKSY